MDEVPSRINRCVITVLGSFQDGRMLQTHGCRYTNETIQAPANWEAMRSGAIAILSLLEHDRVSIFNV